MRPQPDQPRQPSRRESRAARKLARGSRLAGRGRSIVIALLVLAFVLLISVRGIAGFYTDYLWFDSMDLAGVWGRVLATKATLAGAGGLIFFVLCWVNLSITERLAPVFRPTAGEDDLIEKYHQIVGSRAWMVRMFVSVFMALFIGVTLGAAWNDWILFANRVDFGQKDAVFNTDIGFYVFQLPFLTSLTGWLFSSLLVILMLTVLAHIVNGGIRFNTQLDRITPQVKAHLSVLIGILALIQTGRFWLSRYALTFSTRGTVDGATYTDVNVELPAIYLLMLISLFAFGLFIANIWRRGWVLPVMAVGLWVLVAVLAGEAVPAAVQRLRVQPTESTLERPYIENNIQATRDAYGLGDVEQDEFDWTEDMSAEALGENMGTMANVRLWDTATMQSSFDKKQEFRKFYAITDVDVDRYELDGGQTSVMIAARDLDAADQDTWEAKHLIYTNGYGYVAATASDKLASGDPNLLAQDIPVKTSEGMPEVDEPRIYIGENKDGYVIVNADVAERSPDDIAEVTPYDGKDGVRLGSGFSGFVRTSAFALRFGDFNLMVSGNINADSRVLLERDVTERVEALAPFLAYDHDPYVVVADGRLQYVLDGYTTTRNYPNAQRADTGGLDETSGLFGRSFNYARNSVKAVVDAYDGTVKLYVVDDEDPMIRAYQKAFPDLFTPGDEASEELVSHFRYPEDLFTVQTQMWTKYHIEDPTTFYKGNEAWAIPADTGATRQQGSSSTAIGPDGQELTKDDRYPSQYVLMQMPGESDASFLVLRPYVTASDDDAQNQLRAFIVADSDPDNYGQIKTYVMPSSNLPDGPNLAADNIAANGDVGDRKRALCTDKTICTFASPQIVPVGNSLMYVQSFLVAGSEQGAPQLEHVIVNYLGPGGSEVKIDTSLRGALVQLFGPDVPEGIEDAGGATTVETTPGESPDGEEDPDPTGTLTEQESRLIDDIVTAFDEADAAARDGDQVAYAEKIAEAGDLAAQLQELRDSASDGEAVPTDDGTTTTTTSPETTTTTSAGA